MFVGALATKKACLLLLGQAAHWWLIGVGTGGTEKWMDTEGMDKEKVTDIP